VTWWLAALGLALVFVVVSSLALQSFRRSVRQELARQLRERHPEIELVAERPDRLELRVRGSIGSLELRNLYSLVAAGGASVEGRARLIEGFLEGALAQIGEAGAPLSASVHGDRLLPRLAPESLLAEAGPDERLIHRPSGIPGLVISYVLDSDKSVMYLTEPRLEELALTRDELHERALANLRRSFPTLVVRTAIEKQQVSVVRAGDSFDATRLLLVPEALGEGEELAALIPDRETLVLCPPPADGDWAPLRKLARSPASSYTLLEQPVRVTRAGFVPV
jgi:hypothetical protein